jgi:DNA-directed RNA polymerase specialized sigma24 family protein
MDPRQREHPLRETHPLFLGLLDADPQRAWAELWTFAARLLRACPPRATAGWSLEEHEDLLSTVVMHCCRDDFRVLRRYRDVGRPFAAWLLLVARNKALDATKRRRPEPMRDERDAHTRLCAVDPPADDVVASREALEITRRCIDGLSENCRLLLLGAADGLSGRGLALFLGWPPEWNKKASDALRECRRQLRAHLQARGVVPGASFEDRRP